MNVNARAFGVALATALIFVSSPAFGELFFSEYVEGSSLNKAIEIYNPDGGTVDLAAGDYELRFFFNGSVSAGTTVDLTGSIASGDVFVVADDGADAAILAVTDQTSVSSFFNGDDAVVLAKGGATVDAIGQVGTDPGSQWGSGNVSTQDNTIRRMSDVCAGDTVDDDAFDPSVEWDGFANDTFDGLGAHTADCAGGVTDPVINEFVNNHTGSDTDTFVEVFGTASTDYSALTLLEIEGDGTGAGTIDDVVTLGVTDGNGYWSTGLDAENGTVTLLLVENFSGMAGDDLDTDNDGTPDVTPWTQLVDCVGITDGGGSDFAYCSTILDSTLEGSPGFTPGGASRIPNGTDTDTAADWVRNDFDGAGIPALDPGTPDPGEALNTRDAENALAGGPIPLINEFVNNHTGADTDTFVEAFGAPDTNFSAFTILEVEGDEPNTGSVDDAVVLGVTDANGFWSTGLDAENGTLTLLLVEGFSGMPGDDLDTDDDGTPDVTPWTAIVDCVAVTDGDAGDLTYCATVLDPTLEGNPGFTPGGASRIPNGTDTDTAADWVRNDFDGAGIPALDPGTPEVGEALNTRDAINALVAGEAPQIVINEIMQNPSAVSDSSGEWFELYNPGDAPVDINGWTLSDAGTNTHLIDNGGPLEIPAGGYLVLGNNGDSGTNGGVVVNYVYSGFFLGNSDDEIILTDISMTEIDRVEWDGGPGFPDPTGASMSLIDPSLDNNAGENWCEASSPFGDGDLGTPGSFNDCSGLVVINEIMQNPDAVGDSAGEWFELHNPSATPVDIEGWTISDNDSDSFVIANGGPLVIPAGGFLVLGNNDDSGTNGGVTVDYSYGGAMFLSNGADELVVMDTGMLEFDRVEWDGGPNFPDPTGASMSLVDPALDNNAGENWCESPTPFGDGDFGTPGMANNCGALPPPVCGDDKSVTLISAIQGTTDTSPMEGMVVEIEGVVVGDLQNPGEFGGLFVQEEDADADGDSMTSEGIFVFTDLAASNGDLVRARGTVLEFEGLTELSPTSDLVICDTGVTPPTPAMPTLPLSDANQFEAIESMSIVMPQALVINDVFTVARFGDLTVSSTRRTQPTAAAAPGAPANAVAAANALDQLLIDDRRIAQNALPPINGQDDMNPISADNPIRNGQVVTGVTGVMHYAFGAWRVQPTQPFVIDESANPRTAMPAAVGGTLKVAGYNVLNFFTTIDTGASICGPMGDQGCRGADSLEEYMRQLDKLVAAIVAMDADVLGLVELENNASNSLQALVDAVNTVMGAGTYDFIDTGTIGMDVIKVGFIYKPAAVTPEGDFALLNSMVDPRFDDSLNRPALAQSFRATDNLALFTPIVNHFKSKSCSGATGADQDQGDGQGCFNATRTSAAEALRDWANGDPTGAGSDAVLIIGDLNSYPMEDPIQAILSGSFTSLEPLFGGPDAYSYVFFGQKGSLDYALSSAALTPKITGTVPWSINADETVSMDYNTEFNPPTFYGPTPYRSSDHDPIIVGMDLNPPASLTIPTLADGVDAFIEVTTPGGDKCGFSAAEFVDPASLTSAPPANLVFPYGVLQFTVERCTPGTTATINVTLPVIPDLLAWLKHTEAGGWDLYPYILDGNTFSFDVVDGGMGDEDNTANGTIVDPSGPAVVQGGASRATFAVRKDFDDDNPAEVAVTLSCNTGLPLEQTTMIAEGDLVEFVVGDFLVGDLNCSVSEEVPQGYEPAHAASLGYLGIANSVISGDNACQYLGVSNGQFVCEITNTLQAVEVTINKEWIDDNPEYNLPLLAWVELGCSEAGFIGGQYISPAEPGVFEVYPFFDGETCVVTEEPEAGVIRDLQDCEGLAIEPGQDAECTVVNTRLYAGIPTLSQYGLLILSVLMLLMGATAVRRFT